ncbi:conserved Plasmodium protein, unknown function [Plasmodium vivax]|uniref:(malaria parasite P. vivax) hypothetical protein n=1 Tax=Plasmodium vivax TaxID=5855 RepID=A0A1G4HIB7_PLAVI|nr:unnamed protein product [Plasmodium vivax]CAI7722777.1 conserved protein, unknown function [Plasmodium vivax]SCO69234.1 conserved Plasmodium protein, unknown function [Plasmodium vivax]SCO74710.1 conserved Plasmodium protein, unknown function [Plasmodium vivax]VUZ98185.1 conserved protein, unknown function [Plasmodium vivax]
MKIYTFAYMCIFSFFAIFANFATRGVKVQRSYHYISTQVFRSAYAKKTAKKKALSLSPHREETYLEAVQSNIVKATRGVNSPCGLAIITLALGSLVGLLYKRRKATTGEGPHGPSARGDLFKYKCVKCNLVIFPAKGRDQKFVKENFICPNCGQSNMNKHLTKE